MYYYSTIRLILIYRPLEGGRLSRPRYCSKCAAHAQSCVSQWFSRKHSLFLQHDSNLGSLAPQASVLPLDHCDLHCDHFVTYVTCCRQLLIINICVLAHQIKIKLETNSVAPISNKNELETRVSFIVVFIGALPCSSQFPIFLPVESQKVLAACT